jgi:hypothetical protein
LPDAAAFLMQFVSVSKMTSMLLILSVPTVALLLMHVLVHEAHLLPSAVLPGMVFLARVPLLLT